MRRRKFLQLISVGSFGIGSGVYLLSCLDVFFNEVPSPYLDDHDILDKLAFIETVYPLFSVKKLLGHSRIINSRKKDWETINRIFLKSFFYKQSPKKFYTYRIEERESVIVDFIKKYKQINNKLLLEFEEARKRLVIYVIRNSFSPYSAFGYPDKKALPFMADPSWSEYHVKPGSIANPSYFYRKAK